MPKTRNFAEYLRTKLSAENPTLLAEIQAEIDRRVKAGFEVRASFPLEDDFSAIDDRLEQAAGIPSEFSGAGACMHGCGRREHGWNLRTFQQARRLKENLEEAGIPELVVTIREN